MVGLSLQEEGQRGERNFPFVMKRSLTKQERIKKKPDIDWIFRHGKKYSCEGVRMLVTTNGFSMDRIVVIPARHYGNAVERNRMKRQIKEIWRLEKQEFRPGLDFVFVVSQGKGCTYETRTEQLKRLFREAGVYKPSQAESSFPDTTLC